MSTTLADCNIVPQSVSTSLTFSTQLKRSALGCPAGYGQQGDSCISLLDPRFLVSEEPRRVVDHHPAATAALRKFNADVKLEGTSSRIGTPKDPIHPPGLKRSTSAIEVGDIQTLVTATLQVGSTLCFSVGTVTTGNTTLLLDHPIHYEITLSSSYGSFPLTYLYTAEQASVSHTKSCRCWFEANTCSISTDHCPSNAAACCNKHVGSPGQLYCAFGASDMCYAHWAIADGTRHDVFRLTGYPTAQGHLIYIKRTQNGVVRATAVLSYPDGVVGDDTVLVNVNGWSDFPTINLDKLVEVGDTLYDVRSWNEPTSWDPQHGGWLRDNSGVHVYNEAEFCAAGQHSSSVCAGTTSTFLGTFDNSVPTIPYTPTQSVLRILDGFLVLNPNEGYGSTVVTFGLAETDIGFTYQVARVSNFGCTYVNLLESSQSVELECWASGFSVPGQAIFHLNSNDTTTLSTAVVTCDINTNCTFTMEMPGVPYTPVQIHVCTETNSGTKCLYYLVELNKVITPDPHYYADYGTTPPAPTPVDSFFNWNLGGLGHKTTDYLVLAAIIVGVILVAIITFFIIYKCRNRKGSGSTGANNNFVLLPSTAPAPMGSPILSQDRDIQLDERSVQKSRNRRDGLEEISLDSEPASSLSG